MHLDIINYIKANNVKMISKNTTFQDLISISSKNPPKLFVVTNANKKVFGVIIYNDLFAALAKQLKKKNIDYYNNNNIYSRY